MGPGLGLLGEVGEVKGFAWGAYDDEEMGGWIGGDGLGLDEGEEGQQEKYRGEYGDGAS